MNATAGAALVAAVGKVYTVPKAATSAAPAVAFMNLYRSGTMYFAWRDKATGKVGYAASFNTSAGYRYHAFTSPQFVPQALTGTTPALAANGTTVWAAWTGNGTGQKLWYADGGAPLAPNPAG